MFKTTKKGIKAAYRKYVKGESSPMLRKLAAEVRREELKRIEKRKQ